MPKALFLSPESPYPAIGGGPLRSASLLEYLKQCGVLDEQEVNSINEGRYFIVTSDIYWPEVRYECYLEATDPS